MREQETTGIRDGGPPGGMREHGVPGAVGRGEDGAEGEGGGAIPQSSALILLSQSVCYSLTIVANVNSDQL